MFPVNAGTGEMTLGARVRHLVPAPIRLAAARVYAEHRAADIERQLGSIARDPRPIAVGPWLGEVGFELLYWIPFIRWFAERYAVPADRLIAVTRGGAAAWYAPLAVRSYDALRFMSMHDFRRRNADRSAMQGEQKQVAVSKLDDDVIALVRQAEGCDCAVLHPSLMYRLFAPYWWGHHDRGWVRRYARFVPLPRPALDLDLPRNYTAVKFYFNDCFRNTPANRAFVEHTIGALAQQGPVISLSTGVTVDDHAPCEPDVAAMHAIRHLMAPDTNLLVQSAVVSGARQFVGTYGGFAYLAPFYGVPAVSYYTHPDGFSVRHLDLVRDVLPSSTERTLLDVVQVPNQPSARP